MKSLLWIAVEFSSAATFLVGAMAGQLIATRTHPIAVIFGSAAWLVVWGYVRDWWVSFVRIEAEAKGAQEALGLMRRVETQSYIVRHMN